MRVRRPAVAGQFYERDPELLVRQIEWSFTHRLGPGSLPEVSSKRKPLSIGFVVPHAGYMYSGPVAAHAYYRLAGEGRPEVVILVGPNHTGIGASVSVYDEGEWITPLGSAEIDSELAREIIRNSRFAKVNYDAHEQEHSLEVQLPFLQYLFKEVKIVPIVMLYQTPEIAEDLASAIVKSVKKLQRDFVVLASSDLSHYEPHEIAVKKDRMAIDKVLKLDAEGLFNVVVKNDISMCGVGPVMTLIYVANSLGRTNSELLKHITSGDVTGEKAWVVGYSSIRIF